jgi:thiol-disulfide isomerase/thioredoxin
MKATRWTLVTLITLGMVWPLLAGELGDKAAALTIKEWVKGKPVEVTKADGKNVYVVEFWATTCPPCLRSIPRLTEMQKKYKDKNVTFVGVSTDSEKTVARVGPFVKEMGEKMDYAVAIDKDGATAKAYMGAFGIRGIPHAFVVDQTGAIVWHTHPMADLEEVIDKMVAGKFDLAAARKLMAKRDEERRELDRLYKYMDEYFVLVQSADKDKQAAELGQKILEAGSANASVMNALAWNILTKEGIVSRDLKLALTAADVANKATKGEDPMILDTYALALFENDQKAEAVKTQLKAVELAKKNHSDQKELIAELKGRLERFKEAVE